MTADVRHRPSLAGAQNGGVPARRAVIRWGWRFFRREWRQQLLVMALLAVASGTTVFGAAVAVNAPPPRTVTFGTANHLAVLPGGPRLGAEIAAIRQRFGTVDVIGNERLATGSVSPAELRAQDPAGRYGRPLLALVSGRYPTGPGQVAVTSQVATLFSLHPGGRWQAAGRSWRVVGVVENPTDLLDEFALVAPGQLPAPSQVTVLFDATQAAAAGFAFPPGVRPQAPPAPPAGFSPAVVVLAVDTFGLIFIALVAAAGFTVMARRRLRALGMLSAMGATARHVRLVMMANGAAAGVTGTLTGATAGFAAWLAYAPHLEASAGHRINSLSLPWWAIAVAMALAVAAATVAARRPAQAVTQLPAVAALSGRPADPKAAHRSAIPTALLLVGGVAVIAFASGLNKNGGGGTPELVAGLVAVTAGLLLLGLPAIAGLAAAAGPAPLAARLALRDLGRYRARSGAALGAVSFAVFIAMIACIAATARYANPVDYFGPNLPPDQLVLYTPYGAFQAGHSPPLGPPAHVQASPRGGGVKGGAPVLAEPSSARELRQLRAAANGIAAALHSHSTLTLYSAVNPAGGPDGGPAAILQQVTGDRGIAIHTLYVATPALLSRYHIGAAQIDPRADILTSRPGLPGAHGLELTAGAGGPGGCPPATCVSAPRVEYLGQLPADISSPNLLISGSAMHRLGLRQTVGGWLIQAPRPLTAAQINTARQLAAAAGATIETKSQNPSLSELRNGATAGGIVIALGVLAMTVGLIRSETASDLRTLAAAGAGPGTRRTLTAVTAGAIGLLGAWLGTATAYLVTLAWFRSQLSTTLSHVPAADLAVVLVGLPLAAAAGGWLFAGREPAVLGRQPIE